MTNQASFQQSHSCLWVATGSVEIATVYMNDVPRMGVDANRAPRHIGPSLHSFLGVSPWFILKPLTLEMSPHFPTSSKETHYLVADYGSVFRPAGLQL